jgi:hypothetical protein
MIKEAIGLRDRSPGCWAPQGIIPFRLGLSLRRRAANSRARSEPASCALWGPAGRLPRKWSMTLQMSKNAAVQYQISYKFH